MNIHIDTSFPCSLQGPGQGWEGGWSVDFEVNRCCPLDSVDYFVGIFTREEMHPQMEDLGWFC